MNCCRIRFVCFFNFCVLARAVYVCVRVSYYVFGVFRLCYCLVVSTGAIDCLERLVSKMPHYMLSCVVKSYTLTHSLHQ